MLTALIVGAASQDGTYLARLLLSKDYRVVGTFRSSGDDLTHFTDFKTRLILEPADLLNPSSLNTLIQKYQPHEIYNLAALSLPLSSWSRSALVAQVNGLGPIFLLEAIREFTPSARFFQAGSREIFGPVTAGSVDENTPVHPNNPYAASKAYAYFMTQIYRQHHRLFAVNGILFNHESPHRPLDFVVRKITAAAACLKNNTSVIPVDSAGQPVLNSQRKLALWDLASPRDRGFAGDYVQAMWLMLQNKIPRDYVIASGQNHSLQEICEVAFSFVGLNWKDNVVADAPKDYISSPSAVGDASAIKKDLGWSPQISFKNLIEMMVQSDLKLFI